MAGFIELCTVFIGGCASFFMIPLPFLGGITIFEFMTGFLAAKIILRTISIVFGVHMDDDISEPKTVLTRFKRKGDT